MPELKVKEFPTRTPHLRAVRVGPIGQIILNNPEKRNPLSHPVLEGIKEAAKMFEKDERCKVILIKGEGKCFCAGYDLSPEDGGKNHIVPEEGYYIDESIDNINNSYNLAHLDVYMSLYDNIKPVVAQIHHWCLAGGLELTGFVDFRICGEDAKMGWPVGRNLSPGNLPYLTWLIGPTHAFDMYMNCDPMTAQQALAWGWATRVYPNDVLEAETMKMCLRLAEIDTELALLSKKSIHAQMDAMGFRTGLKWGAEYFTIASMRTNHAIATGEEIGSTKFIFSTYDKGLTTAFSERDVRGQYRMSDAQKAEEAKKQIAEADAKLAAEKAAEEEEAAKPKKKKSSNPYSPY